MIKVAKFKCAKCKFESEDWRLFQQTGHELNRRGYVIEIELCNRCIYAGLTELDKQLYFKSFDFEEYIRFCSMFRGRQKYLRQMEGYFRGAICSGDEYWRTIDRGDRGANKGIFRTHEVLQ